MNDFHNSSAAETTAPAFAPLSVPAFDPLRDGRKECCRLLGRLFVVGSLAAVTALNLGAGDPANAASLAPIAARDRTATFVTEASQRFNIPVTWLQGVMHVESGGNAHAVSPKGAMGLMQIMPETWSALRARYHLGADPFDPHDNIIAGAGYLRELLDRFGMTGFLAAYNAGPTRLEEYLAGLRPLQDETKRYISKLSRLLPELSVNGVFADAQASSDWRTASLFGSASAPPSLSPHAAAEGPTDRNATTDRFALAPQSNGLFVPVSATRR